jgi:hypothetical protein
MQEPAKAPWDLMRHERAMKPGCVLVVGEGSLCCGYFGAVPQLVRSSLNVACDVVRARRVWQGEQR